MRPSASGSSTILPCRRASVRRSTWRAVLNDGLAVPFFLVAMDISMATLKGRLPSAVLSNALSQIGWGIAAGVGAGLLGGLLLRLESGRGWLLDQWRQAFTLAVALSAYAAASALGGSGFIAAFVGGMAFGGVSGEHGLRETYLTEEVGGLLAAVTWMGFGALAISSALPHITWQVVLYALLSLTVVRMVPVAIAMARSGARLQTVTFIGWFGPRGLASIVFGLLALERGVPESQALLTTVVVTVGLSVFLHGLTSVPLVAPTIVGTRRMRTRTPPRLRPRRHPCRVVGASPVPVKRGSPWEPVHMTSRHGHNPETPGALPLPARPQTRARTPRGQDHRGPASPDSSTRSRARGCAGSSFPEPRKNPTNKPGSG